MTSSSAAEVFIVQRLLTLVTGVRVTCPVAAYETEDAAKKKVDELSRELAVFSKSQIVSPLGRNSFIAALARLGIGAVETQIVRMEVAGMLLKPEPSLILPQ